jgi:predicted dehydrogenase
MLKIPGLPVRIVVAGCGAMAQQWIQYALARPDCRVVGLVDLNLATAQAVAAQHHLIDVAISSNLADTLRQTQADLVFNLAIPAAHRLIALTALQAGCSVMSEKPLAASLAEADELIAAAAAKGLTYSVMQNRRFLKPIRALRRLIADKVIGTPGYIGADFFLGPHFGGFRDVMDDPLLLDMAIHTFDQARLILGSNARSVFCQSFNPPGSWYRGHASAVALFTMDNGAVFCYRGSWCAVGCPTSWESEWRVTGSQGTALWDGKGMPWAETIPSGSAATATGLQRIEAVDVWSGREGHDGCLDHLFDALLAGLPAETAAADNRNSLAMVMGAIESARTGLPVTL